jgi:hypothetical protein
VVSESQGKLIWSSVVCHAVVCHAIVCHAIVWHAIVWHAIVWHAPEFTKGVVNRQQAKTSKTTSSGEQRERE